MAKPELASQLLGVFGQACVGYVKAGGASRYQWARCAACGNQSITAWKQGQLEVRAGKFYYLGKEFRS